MMEQYAQYQHQSRPPPVQNYYSHPQQPNDLSYPPQQQQQQQQPPPPSGGYQQHVYAPPQHVVAPPHHVTYQQQFRSMGPDGYQNQINQSHEGPNNPTLNSPQPQHPFANQSQPQNQHPY
jgi:hypothetical protein